MASRRSLMTMSLIATMAFSSTCFAAAQKTAQKTAQSTAIHAESSAPSPAIKTPVFPSHATETARTLEPWQVGFRPAAGTNVVHSFFLANALSIGLTRSLEIGTIPVFYLLPVETYNFTSKLNIKQSLNWDFALGLTYVNYKNLLGSDGITESVNPSFMTNWRPVATRWQFGLNLGVQVTNHDFPKIDKHTQKVEPSASFDAAYPIFSRNVWCTAGLSQSTVINRKTFAVVEAFGFGNSLTWRNPLGLFSALSGGVHYTPVLEDVTYLFSVVF